MAKSKFEYVRQFETQDRCLPNCWIVVRIDGKNFHKFSDVHNFKKPNDLSGLQLMSKAASSVMTEFKDIILAYGQSDEYSFVLKKDTSQYGRRASKLATTISSLFAASFVFSWPTVFPDKTLHYPPAFDGRCVLYPSDKNLRDYLSWRQADCHINNLYNTCFWTLVQEGNCSPKEAEEKLRGTVAGEKNELLFSQFGINYNNIPEIFRKGATLIWTTVEEEETCGRGTEHERTVMRKRRKIEEHNGDIIGDDFWSIHPELLGENR
ncbi:probable tRNA(His) guanylyltransferase [Diadema setosum]|uniref:probable tRNA(His) guanylyltransferase n=1 Tax=Diadema setosum TaxID=31175 RepID=UPI003B3B468D